MASAGLDWRRVAAAVCLNVDWTQIAVAALGSTALAGLVADSLHRFGRRLEADVLADQEVTRADEAVSSEEPATSNEAPSRREYGAKGPTVGDQPASQDATAPTFVDPKARRAAEVLGVDVGASEDTIRAALRARLSCSRLHPDHGGDGEEATSLIAAKNFLIERARAMRP